MMGVSSFYCDYDCFRCKEADCRIPSQRAHTKELGRDICEALSIDPRSGGRKFPLKAETERSPFASALVSARRSHGMSQRMLAAEIGVCTDTVSQWELGRRMPLPELMTVLLDMFPELKPVEEKNREENSNA